MHTPIVRAVVSDLDGVVYRGDNPVPGAVEAINLWASCGVPYVFVTNNASKSATAFAEKLSRLGIAARPDQVLTSADAAAVYVRRTFRAGVSTYVIGEAVLHEALAREGASVADRDDVEVVVLGFDYALTYAKLRRAMRALMGGAALIVTNPDMITPTSDGYEPCVGTTLAALKAAVPGVKPVVAGKPSPVMITEALRRLGSKPEETIMVGDQIFTDIIAGQAAGLRSFLVRTGVPVLAHETAVPDAIIETLLDIPVSSVFGTMLKPSPE